ncbi:hypothetical protein J3U21_03915 [Gilliamella sp. B2776]|uniref:lipase family alpha/beta hydrolase n=1 Tax=unclassified Gilliamella TaxID=2685620 RepID=UPI002269E30C|nr:MULTISPECIES: hypothetical protein [unclassified Gilliamella]MCX8649213.1 hypothetical protein [Gilliamella sp. B2779]MCX8655173.1 hypothetical protein [Gilliamella sp. B2737]MCX8691292.1 hypothetical protein [Gilliamella sp. B2776]MCX8702183.1 hypothetical protein [Gilliamella sp. B2781]WDM19287.1 hypothetical protein J4T76_02760 [Gilliamella sp. B3022]
MTENNNHQQFEFNTVPRSDNSIEHITLKKERQVIPIIFLPGVMGSNLKVKAQKNRYEDDNENNGEDDDTEAIWRLDNITSLAKWILWRFGNAKARRKKLHPQKTQVDNRGKVIDAATNQINLIQAYGMAEDQGINPSNEPTQVQINKAIKNHPENKLFGTRRERGWGTVGYISYGKFLEKFQSSLFQANGQLSDKLRSLTKSPSFELDKDKNEEEDKITLTFTQTQIDICKNYDLPLYAMGYNWLESNEESAKRLKTLVEKTIPAFYKKQGRICDKVILITHSMGGLVARYYTEVLGGHEKVYGVINGVQPATGAVAAYTRMKRGNEANWAIANVLGKDAAEMTAVLGQAPGPLQLLPSADYGMGWLTITNPEIKSDYYPKTDPYKEIYLNKKDWWCVCEPHLINPFNTNHDLTQMQKDWEDYEDLINEKVVPFHEAINKKYFKNTYVFYGIDHRKNIQEKYLTYDTAHWQGEYIQGYKSEAKKPFKNHIGAENRLDLSEMSETRTVTTENNYWIEVQRKAGRTHVKYQDYKGNIAERYTLKPAVSNGDGTVPQRSGEIPIESIKVRMHLPIEHEPAYKNSITQEFTLRAVINILLEVNKQNEKKTAPNA